MTEFQEPIGMFADLPIQFEHPVMLLVLLLIVPVVLLARMGSAGQGRGKLIGSVVVRTILILLLAVSLARPSVVDRGESVTLMVVADVSRSIPRELQRESGRFLERVADAKRNEEDRIGVVTVAEESEIRQTPDMNAVIQLDHAGDLAATDLASAMRTAISLLPTDTANRILLVSDGNETESNLLEAVELARANDIPVDVLPIEYEYGSEIVFEQLRAPNRARLGQSVDLRAFLRSSSETSGVLRIFQNDALVDLDPGSTSDGIRIDLEPGSNTVSIPVTLESGGAQRFRAEFSPDDPDSDAILENNVYESVTFVASDGRALVIDEGGTETTALVSALRTGGVEVVVEPPSSLLGGIAFLNGFDTVILANVPRWSIDQDADRSLRSYVHDLGGGLVMIGGDEGFGAGGWIESETAKVLPVRLDPPQERQMVRGALALIMHSCEMAKGNYWGQQTAIAAIDALSSLDYVGIVTFNWGQGGQGVNGCSWAFPMQPAGDKSAAIAAAKKMVIGDMPDFGASMTLARQGLNGVNAGQKHVIIISDGDAVPPSKTLLDQYVADGLTVTTVSAAGHGTPKDRQNMQGVAEFTGGTFYNVSNPKMLPKIFIKEATLVTRTLLMEGDFQPSVSATLDGPTRGVGSVPGIGGFVLTVPKEGLVKIPMVVPTEEGEDPLLAYWNYGLGKSVAFTSDAGGRWSTTWPGWSGFQPFWEQIVRWSMRPSSPPNLMIRASTGEDGRAVVEVEAMGADGGMANFLQGQARVIDPTGASAAAPLQQIGPGRYRTEFELEQQGAYLVNVLFPEGDGGERSAASIQAAISVPYEREFSTVRDNRALLESIAAKTGGTVFGPSTDFEMVDPFDRTGLEMPSSPTRIWDLLVVVAAGLFVVDVAVRRLTFDSRAAREAAAKAMASGTSTADSTVEAWKTARKRAGRRGGAESAGATRFDTDETVDGDFSVTEDLSAADRSTDGARPPRRERSNDEASKSDEVEEDMTSRLLRAKRRATGRDDDGAANG